MEVLSTKTALRKLAALQHDLDDALYGDETSIRLHYRDPENRTSDVLSIALGGKARHRSDVYTPK